VTVEHPPRVLRVPVMVGVILSGFFVATVASGTYFAISDPPLAADGTRVVSFSALIVGLLSLWVGFAIIPARLFLTGRRNQLIAELRPTIRWQDTKWIIPGALLQIPASIPYRVWDAVTDDNVTGRLGDSAEELFESSSGMGPSFWVLAVLVAVGAPLVEELVFRCGFHGAISSALTTTSRGASRGVLSVVISAVTFGAFHLQPLQFVALTIFGAAAGTLFHFSRRLGPPMMLHVGFNLITVIALGAQLADASQ
jgi:membrane protease YdiL (CAAX protease family)